MTRHLYIMDTETGKESGHVDVTDMKPMEIIALEAQLRAKCGDDAVVLDTDVNPRID